MKQLAVIISPNYKDYAERFLSDCLASLSAQSYKDFDIFLIDNETSDSSFALLQKLAPGLRIFRREHNDGFAGGNNAALKVAIDEGYEFAMLLNMDTVSDPEAVGRLVEGMKAESKAGAIQARLMLWPDKEIINSIGNTTHFLGFGFSLGYREGLAKAPAFRTEIAYPSGAAVIFRCSSLKEVGLLDEVMWMYNEDQDLGWRLWLAGWSCLMEPTAVVYHKYEFSRSITKYYWMDRNRVIAMLKNYHWLTLLLVAPPFILMEGGLTLFSFTNGWWPEKKKVWKYFFNTKNLSYILAERKRVQKTRVTKEKDIIKLFSGRIWYQEVDDVKLRLINPVFELYWGIVRFIVVALGV